MLINKTKPNSPQITLGFFDLKNLTSAFICFNFASDFLLKKLDIIFSSILLAYFLNENEED